MHGNPICLCQKLRHPKMLLVNTELDDKHIILDLAREKDKLGIKGMGEKLSNPLMPRKKISDF
jgi:hypothetical protein